MLASDQTTISPPRLPPPFSHLREQHGGDEERAFEEYGRAQTVYYEAQLRHGRCVFCNSSYADRIAVFDWFMVVFPKRDAAKTVALAVATAAMTALLFGHAHAAAHGRHLIFTTRHAVCESCFRRWHWRGRLLTLFGVLGFGVALLGFMAGGLFLLFGFFGHPVKPRDRAGFKLYGSIAVAAGFVGVIMATVFRRMALPPALRHVRGGGVHAGAAKLVEQKESR